MSDVERILQAIEFTRRPKGTDYLEEDLAKFVSFRANCQAYRNTIVPFQRLAKLSPRKTTIPILFRP